MIVVAGTAKIKTDSAGEVEALIAEVVRLTQQEPGCSSYSFYRDIGDPATIHVFEEWESEESLAAHLQKEHTQRFLSSLGEYLTGPPAVNRYDVGRVASLF